MDTGSDELNFHSRFEKQFLERRRISWKILRIIEMYVKEFEISFFPSTRKFRNAIRLFSRHGGGKGEKFSRGVEEESFGSKRTKTVLPF